MTVIWTREFQLKILLDELYAAQARYRDAKQDLDDLYHQTADACDIPVIALRLLIEEREPGTERERQHLDKLFRLIDDEDE